MVVMPANILHNKKKIVNASFFHRLQKIQKPDILFIQFIERKSHQSYYCVPQWKQIIMNKILADSLGLFIIVCMIFQQLPRNSHSPAIFAI